MTHESEKRKLGGTAEQQFGRASSQLWTGALFHARCKRQQH